LVGATITSLDDLKASPGVSGNPLATSMITAFESALQAIAQAAAQGGTGGVTAAAA
jgi:hypothetical protein